MLVPAGPYASSLSQVVPSAGVGNTASLREGDQGWGKQVPDEW